MTIELFALFGEMQVSHVVPTRTITKWINVWNKRNIGSHETIATSKLSKGHLRGCCLQGNSPYHRLRII